MKKIERNSSMISVGEALEKVLKCVNSMGCEEIHISDALDRILAEDVVSTANIPDFDNSAMDGFAIISQDVLVAKNENPISLTIIDNAKAGLASSKILTNSKAIRIMTGAMVPQGANAVVMVENTEADGNVVKIFKKVEINENIRFKGESIKTGDLVMTGGEKLTPAHIGMLASLGIVKINVSQKPRVAILATGDELVDIDEEITPGKIRTSNTYSLCAQIEKYGAIAINKGIARDDKNDLYQKIKECLDCDIVLTSGGVSMGDYDFVKEILEDDFKVDLQFCKVFMKPGKPIIFGCLENKLFFGLAGNPVSSMVNADVFVRPAIAKMQGCKDVEVKAVDAILDDELKKEDDRETFVRAITQWDNGEYVARLTGPQGSGILQSMVKANSLIIFPPGEQRSIAKGEKIKVRFL